MFVKTIDIPEDQTHKRELWLDDETCAAWLYVNDYTMRIGSARVAMAGIGGVYTKREHRMKGLMRHLYADTVAYMTAAPYDVSMLFGISHFYIKWGYATSLAKYQLSVKTRDAESASSLARALAVRPVAATDMPALVALHNANHATKTCSIVRDPAVFTQFPKGTWWDTDTEAVLWAADDGTPAAYAVWDKKDTEVNVTEVEAVDDTLFPTLLAALAAQAVAKRCETLNVFLPPDDPFAEYCQRFGCEWKIQHPRYSDGMMRILNQQPLFAKLVPVLAQRLAHSPFAGFTGDVALHTDLGTTVLHLDHGKVAVASAGDTALALTLSQDKLMQLIVGYRSIRDVLNDSEVAAMGDVAPLLSILFPKDTPFVWLADYF